MKQKKIGIPRALLYYRYNILWETYFKKIGCKVIISDKTTKKTIEEGKKYSIDESCLSLKIFMGHVYNLINKCDYILIPRVADYGKKDKVCVRFNGIYDIVTNYFPKEKILNYNIEKTKHTSELISLIKIGFKFNKNIFKLIYSYILAKITEKKHNKALLNTQLKLLSSNKPKILLVSHPYNTHDNYIGKPIINKLKKMNIEIIDADIINKKIARTFAYSLSPTLYWIYSKELVGAINYYQNSVDGIIFLTTFPCGPDSLVNELMIRKITTIPTTNILIDELNSNTGLDTRLESFIDIIKERRQQNE